MRNVFIIICSLLETCRFQSLRNSLAVTGVILAVIVQLDLQAFGSITDLSRMECTAITLSTH